MNQLTDKQLIFLDNIVYLDLSNYEDSSISEAIEIILQEDSYFIREMPEGTDYRAQMYPEEWRRLLTSFLEDESNSDFLNNYRIERFQNNDKVGDYFCACSFVKYSEENSDEAEDSVVSFRGTYGNAQEWEASGTESFWARGYYVSTIGNVNEETIKKYISEQEEESKQENTRI